MANCTANSKNTRLFCHRQFKEKLEERSQGKKYREDELKRFEQQAGQEAAGEATKKCIMSAKTAQDKMKCSTGAAAKEAFAKSSGKDASKIRDMDMRKAAAEKAMADMQTKLETCQSEKRTQGKDMRDCVKDLSEFKGQMAAATGKDAARLKDSQVRAFMEKRSRDDALTLVESCTDAASCKETAKKSLAAAVGKESISDFEYKRYLDKALAEKLGDQVRLCVEDAGQNKTACGLCKKQTAYDVLTAAGKTQFLNKEYVDRMLEHAARAMAKDVAEYCEEDKATCKEMASKDIRAAKGICGGPINHFEVEKVEREGALEKAAEEVKACFTARKSQATATCDNPYDKFLQLRKKEQPKDEKEKKADEREVKSNLMMTMMKDRQAACMDEPKDSAQMKECIGGFEAEAGEIAKTLFPELKDDQRRKKMNQEKQKASVKVLGGHFKACMEQGAATAAAAGSCYSKLKDLKDKAGLPESEKDLVLKFHASAVVDAGKACGNSTRHECMHNAKDSMLRMGVAKRQFAMIERLAKVRASAETHAACKEGGNDDAFCIGLAHKKYQELEESDEPLSEEAKEKILKVAGSLSEGKTLVLKYMKNITVDAQTSSEKCSTKHAEHLLGKIRQEAERSGYANQKIADHGCRKIRKKAKYQFKVDMDKPNLPTNAIPDLSDKLAKALNGTSLPDDSAGGRRLQGGGSTGSTVTESYAAQSVTQEGNSSNSSMPSPPPPQYPGTGGEAVVGFPAAELEQRCAQAGDATCKKGGTCSATHAYLCDYTCKSHGGVMMCWIRHAALELHNNTANTTTTTTRAPPPTGR
eukprot:TRINITY_DN6763_c0_g1_i2.p1 TRINITY_DN6763_c0_g1~~TRINITY_DN6763_c0_g1_i2.p1  ORF type:complete len:893 (-),score=238.99 TRINITY_DN6763_c0_g1_i2:101-2536(-)